MKKQLRGTLAQNKYLEFMLKLYSLQSFNRRTIESEFQISHSVCTHLTKRGYIMQKERDQWHWVGGAPTMALVDAIRGSIYLDQQNCKKTKRTEIKQLTIAPVKKYQRTEPIPVKDEPIHDTSNSKMLLILAAGALLGFMIATLIWK